MGDPLPEISEEKQKTAFPNQGAWAARWKQSNALSAKASSAQTFSCCLRQPISSSHHAALVISQRAALRT